MFWVGMLAIAGAGFSGHHIFQFLFEHITGQYPIDPALAAQIQSAVPRLAMVLAAIAIWTLFVKRLHDRGRSAWMFLLFAALAVAAASWAGLFPIHWLPRPALSDLAIRAIGIIGGIGVVWLVVEVLLIPSRPGANRFGPDPLMTHP